jgi:hypothetical protein
MLRPTPPAVVPDIAQRFGYRLRRGAEWLTAIDFLPY